MHMKKFFMTTQRLGFSIWIKDDIKYALELWGNIAVTKFITASGRMSKEEVHNRLNKEIENNNKYHIQYWPIYLLENNQFIGCCGLRLYEAGNNVLEMGVHLKEEYWGKGLAKEACLGVIQYSFKNLKVNALFAGHNPKNISSAILLKKLGFKYTHDEFYEPTGLNHPSYLLTNEEI